ncbi:hypothetical protein AEW14_18230 [Salmonella enterica subsp. enterica serovar Infantis]|nr:hypothetical protein AEW14_18230 [Salmonella enterica subsp. enterica serovar Infantis]KUC93606.1 hypothetical protein DE76_14625 [Salmonella enterica subsp. enterica serovar Braenderup]
MNNTATEQSSRRGENHCSHPGFTISPDVVSACNQKVRTGGVVDGTTDTTTVMKARAGGIHDHIPAETGNIAFSEIKHDSRSPWKNKVFRGKGYGTVLK